ncbi:sugar phosphate nucleotidyltransferase [Sulfolobus acidocaldarius]|uniref:Conserved protein n=4 Tax=Sulfolobus acidocaldarius TaxID=2285 RepID=Q4J6D5_SULAC|nr:NDP-sugar synthase [Sulfolobus acidocaldarius]AAY81645.1 conserved protein [Sulfolobus acidocaldarius DSM 639]AGE72248.1 Nucleotidyl transferase [Sulfolobus acidocaldarius N8]AGE74565.1 Nucleotidyl transferase [Sulfolobus acidocaldarius Ron12/I]ALU29590.1 nucleotidyltransferase [Sulfolobus acidocaldarius]ALU32321.1 nucleotidyltransferase [Sulfolobus acidocaldarius]
MQAIILAGGKGEGLLPYTERVQKETINILGKMILSYSISGLKKAGINDFVVVTTDRGKKLIEDELEKLNVSFEVINQHREGISGAIKDGLEKSDDDNIVIAFGDIVAPEEFYVNLVNAFSVSGSEIVIPLVPVSKGIQTYGLAKITTEGLEVVKEGSTLALAGAYIIKNETFEDFIDYLNQRKSKIKYFIWSGDWFDIGYPEDIIGALEALLSKHETVISSSSEISKTAIIGKKVIIDNNAVIDDYAVVKGPAYIGENAYIGNFSLVRDYSSVERGAKVGAYCEIVHSSIQPGAEIGSKSYLTYSIIGSNSKIGSNVIMSSYPANVIRGRVEKLGALVSPDKEVEHGSILRPGTKI